MQTCQLEKEYCAHHNAAAHILRARFNPRRKLKELGSEEGQGKQAEKGGGDPPPMEVLKNWMKEVEERNINVDGDAAKGRT